MFAQRAQTLAHVVSQVLDPREIHRQGIQFSQRAVFALAVLQHPGGFFDEGASLQFRGRENRVELSLTDDDVHLSSHAGVRKQLLDIQQAHRGAVDSVLRTTGAEHGARYRDFGVVNRQGTVRVVDGELYLGAPQGSFGFSAGENHVRHLAATQVLGALFTHHPRQGINHIGFPRTVGADDAGHARFQREMNRVSERLEAFQRQGFEIHPFSLRHSGPVS